jgi:beta-lactamase superfamily II metal-dependent hydrolase
VVFPHHGGKPGNKNIKAFTARFCEAVKPNIVIFSIRENVKHFPTPVVVETVAKTLENVRMFSTRSSGILKAFIENTGSQLLHQEGVGTILVDLTKEPLDVDFISDGINE